MSENDKITADHLRRCAFVYVRQSSAAQVAYNRESTDRQYQLVDRAVAFGWKRDLVSVIDEDLGVSGSGLAERSGFAHMTAQVALGHAGLILGLEAPSTGVAETCAGRCSTICLTTVAAWSEEITPS